ncbi:hypothetical protein MMC07_001338 [Pseudocyphellaria aurata]|nr:hypothetical protein [Pseudocyphellaria aurata]
MGQGDSYVCPMYRKEDKLTTLPDSCKNRTCMVRDRHLIQKTEQLRAAQKDLDEKRAKIRRDVETAHEVAEKKRQAHIAQFQDDEEFRREALQARRSVRNNRVETLRFENSREAGGRSIPLRIMQPVPIESETTEEKHASPWNADRFGILTEDQRTRIYCWMGKIPNGKKVDFDTY